MKKVNEETKTKDIKERCNMTTIKNEVTVNPVVQEAIDRTNEVATKLEVERNALFDVVRGIVEQIGKKRVDLTAYRKGIEETHRSTVYVMITAASNPLLTRFKSKLPESYQTLYELHKLSKLVGDDRLIGLIESKDIHSKMSKADVTSLRKRESNKITDLSKEKTALTDLGNEDNVVSTDHDEVVPVKISTLDEMKSAFDALDETAKTQFAAYVMSLTSQQKEAA